MNSRELAEVAEIHESHGTCTVCQIDVHRYCDGPWEHVIAPHGSPLTRHEPIGRATCCDQHRKEA